MVKHLIAWIDRQKISITEWLAAFTGILFVRFILEAYSSPSPYGIVTSEIPTFIHYWLFYLDCLLGIACILHVFTENTLRIGKLLLFGCLALWLAPVIDLIISGGPGVKMSYLFGGLNHLLTGFFVFFFPVGLPGLTPGIRIEVILMLCGLGTYIWACRKSAVATLMAVFSLYTYIFIMLALPSVLYSLWHLFSYDIDVTGRYVVNSLYDAIASSAIHSNELHDGLPVSLQVRNHQNEFNAFMSQIHFLIVSMFAIIWFRCAFPKKFKAIIGNCRPERIGFYLSLLALGMLFALELGLKAAPIAWVDIVSALTLALSWCCAWMYAVHINDIADTAIDTVSNSTRPLVRGSVSIEEMRQTSFLWLTASLIGSYIVGYYPFYTNMVFTACYYIYSAPPLRLKRVPLLSSLLIAVAVLSTVLAGFFFLSGDKKLDVFPRTLAAGIVLIFALGVNIRDVKDVAGDRAEGIKTLPVLFGKYGVKLVGILFALSFLLVPLVLQRPVLFYVAFPAALAAYLIAVRKPYDERLVFTLYFCAIGSGAVLYKFFPSGLSGIF